MKGDKERAAGRLTREGKRKAVDAKGGGESSVRREHARREYPWPVAYGWHFLHKQIIEKKTKRRKLGWRFLVKWRSSLLSPALGRAATLHIRFGVCINSVSVLVCLVSYSPQLLGFFLICISQANALICFSKEFLSITRMRWLHYFITLLNSSGATAPINKPVW